MCDMVLNTQMLDKTDNLRLAETSVLKESFKLRTENVTLCQVYRFSSKAKTACQEIQNFQKIPSF